TALCDHRRDASFFDSADEAGMADVPHVIGGRFVPHADTRGWKRWRAELFDYLVCHPEFAEPQVVRIFHIGCARHLLSMGIARVMGVRPDLECPFGSASCPIQAIKAHRRSRCT